MKTAKGYPQPLGVTAGNGKMNFAVSVPARKRCELLLYRTGQNEPAEIFDMPEEEGLGKFGFLRWMNWMGSSMNIIIGSAERFMSILL